MNKEFMEKPCKHCPFRRDVTPFLTTPRAEEIAFAACNPYNSFPCHKTLDYDDDGETMAVSESLQCAGFLTMQAVENGRVYYEREGFNPDYDGVYDGAYEMVDVYTEHNESRV